MKAADSPMELRVNRGLLTFVQSHDDGIPRDPSTTAQGSTESIKIGVDRPYHRCFAEYFLRSLLTGTRSRSRGRRYPRRSLRSGRRRRFRTRRVCF